MESIIFANSPLADYLEGNGESNPVRESHNSFVEPSEPAHDFVPPPSNRFRTRFSSKKVDGLRFNVSNSDKQSPMSRALSRALDTTLSGSENSQFLEQFRYTLVASQLLNETINVSHYARKGEPDKRLADDSYKTIIWSIVTAKEVVIGGCAVLASIIATWMFRGWDVEGVQPGKSYNTAILYIVVVGFAVVQVKRRWLRVVRHQAIEMASRFVEASQIFDSLATDAVTVIQEVELVSRGYRLSTPLPPITRIERESQTKRCSRMRRSVLSALKLGIPAHIRAYTMVQKFAVEIDMTKYHDIYDVSVADLEELNIGVNEDEFADMESLKALKVLLHRLHTVRRVFLCCLLALDAKGNGQDFPKWRSAVEQLSSLSELMAELSRELRRVLTEEEQFAIPPTPKLPLSPSSERVRGQMRKLNSLSQALRGLQAKMHVLREDSDLSLQGSVDYSEFGTELLSHYDSIGADIHALVDEWENSRAALAASVMKKDNRRSMSIGGSTLVGGDTPRTSVYDQNWAEADLMSNASAPLSEDFPEPEKELFEAVSEPFNPRARSNLTREERIRKVQEERIKLAEDRARKESTVNLVKELKDVLDTRIPMPRRRVASAGNPKRFSL